MNERLLGFDAREMWFDFNATWSEQRKRTFLYRLDIVKPLSVDTTVWPSIFQADGQALPRSRFGYQNSWNDLVALQWAVTDFHKKRLLRPFYLIAINVLSGDYSAKDRINWDAVAPPTIPTQKSPEWPLLGYDIADTWALSALSNCGLIRQEDSESLRQEWGSSVSKFHLFTDIESAFAFKQVADRRFVDSHAPFHVFGLWLIGQHKPIEVA